MSIYTFSQTYEFLLRAYQSNFVRLLLMSYIPNTRLQTMAVRTTIVPTQEQWSLHYEYTVRHSIVMFICNGRVVSIRVELIVIALNGYLVELLHLCPHVKQTDNDS